MRRHIRHTRIAGHGLAIALLPGLVGLSGLVGIAAAPTAQAAQDLVVGTYNVSKSVAAPPAPTWSQRRERVARTLTEYGLDLIGLQEATNHAVEGAPTQLADIQRLVAPSGYVAPAIPATANECRRPRDARGELAGPSPCENTAALLFRSATVEQVATPNGTPSAGITTTGRIAPMDPQYGTRSVMWAYLRGTQSTAPFLAVSVHATTEKSPAAEIARMSLGRGLASWAQAMNDAHGFPGAPVVLMADLNSYAKRQPDGAQAQLRATGWTDAFDAPVKRNIQYSTINVNPALYDGNGFPARPYVFRKTERNRLGAATRIDYVMTIGGRPLDYEVVIRLNPDGTFDEAYRGSDHQMVRTTIRLP